MRVKNNGTENGTHLECFWNRQTLLPQVIGILGIYY